MMKDHELDVLRQEIIDRLKDRGIAYEVDERGWIKVLTGLGSGEKILVTRRRTPEGTRVPLLVVLGYGKHRRRGVSVFWLKTSRIKDIRAAVNKAIRVALLRLKDLRCEQP